MHAHSLLTFHKAHYLPPQTKTQSTARPRKPTAPRSHVVMFKRRDSSLEVPTKQEQSQPGAQRFHSWNFPTACASRCRAPPQPGGKGAWKGPKLELRAGARDQSQGLRYGPRCPRQPWPHVTLESSPLFPQKLRRAQSHTVNGSWRNRKEGAHVENLV